MLPGLLQSNQRAELFAVLVACLRDPRPLDIRTDSEWVCAGVASLHGWCHVGWGGADHADLWNALACQLRSRAGSVTVSWVQGHAKEIDVLRGRTTREDKHGNDEADKLAVAGAASHGPPSEVVAAAKGRHEMASEVHQMMLAILLERRSREKELDDAADRGSDFGDDADIFSGSCDVRFGSDTLDDEFDLAS